MAVTVSHSVTAGGTDNPAYDVSKNAWNASHTVSGLGTMAEQNANNVTISGGSVTGITDIAVADGGTGASTAGVARANLQAGFHMQTVTASQDPADATTYYYGCLTPLTTANFNRMSIPRDGTVKAVYIQVFNIGTLGSNETSSAYFRLNDTTDTLVTSSVRTDSTTNTFSNTSMSVSVTAGDKFEMKWVSPTYTTNPTTVFFIFQIYIE